MPKLLNFIRPSDSQPFEIKSKSATKAEIIIYAAIGESWFGDSVSAKSFSDELNKLDKSVNELVVRINSPGGDVFDGIAIYNRLKQHPAKKTIYIDGLAASIASIIALSGDEIIMGEGALYMIHLPWTMTVGDRLAHDRTTERLIDVEEQLVSIYARKTGLTRSEIKQMLEKETWMDAAQAKDKKFVDSTMEESTPIAASVFDKSPWIHKAPKNFNSQSKAINKEVTNLKTKIEEILARKKA